jgi:hypothetical protein
LIDFKMVLAILKLKTRKTNSLITYKSQSILHNIITYENLYSTEGRRFISLSGTVG